LGGSETRRVYTPVGLAVAVFAVGGRGFGGGHELRRCSPPHIRFADGKNVNGASSSDDDAGRGSNRLHTVHAKTPSAVRRTDSRVTLSGMHRPRDSETRDWIAQRTREALSDKRKRGERVGEIPYGYSLSTDRRTLKPNPREMDVVKWVVARYGDGSSLRQLAERLNAHGVVNRAGGAFTHEQVRRMLLRAFSVERLSDAQHLA
jgi:Recombinase